MKPHPSILLLLAVGLTAHTGAQSFGGAPSDPAPVAEQTPEPKKPTAEEKKAEKEKDALLDEEAAKLAASPSRYAGIDVETYVDIVSSSFSMRRRIIDPFGRHQDPNFKPAQPVKIKRHIPKLKKEPVTPFSDIIRAIHVTTVMPAKGSFMVGNRTFRVGQRIPLRMTGGKEIPLHVVSVDSGSITFRNGTTGEVADLSLAIMPDGMSRGDNGKATPPGLIDQNSNAPLIIDSPNPLSSSR